MIVDPVSSRTRIISKKLFVQAEITTKFWIEKETAKNIKIRN